MDLFNASMPPAMEAMKWQRPCFIVHNSPFSLRPGRRHLQLDPKIDQDAKWRHCALSSTPLREPVVACELGRLFRKEALLAALLAARDGTPLPAVAAHIRNLKVGGRAGG